MENICQKGDLITVEKLQKSFGELCVLDGLSFSLSDGDILGIIGPSGSGKTTLLRCLDLLEDFEEGKITYGGSFAIQVMPGGGLKRNEGAEKSDGEEISQSVVRRKIGFVFQTFNLWEDLSVLKNLTLAPCVVLGMSAKEAESRAEQLLSHFDLKDKILSRVWQLSGGQRQRVAIVRALMMKPAMLLCDEVTSALDPLLAFEVLQMIRSLRDEGLTMIVVTHHIEFVASLCNRMAYLDNGNFMQIDTPERILKAPATTEIENFLNILRVAV